MSEYLGIRVAMIDAIQRYQGTTDIAKKTDHEKVVIIQGLLKDAAKENGLLGARGEIIGEAWSRLIGEKKEAGVVAFIENPAIAKMAHDADAVKPQAKGLNDFKAAVYAASNAAALKTMVTGFEDIAQSTGMIDYKGGDSLSATMERLFVQVAKERGATAAQPAKESASAANAVRDLFKTHNGPVDEKFLGGAAGVNTKGHGLFEASASAASAGRTR